LWSGGVRPLPNKGFIVCGIPISISAVNVTQRYQDFAHRNAGLFGLSIASNASHIAWLINIYRNTGIEIPFPVIADRDIQPGVSGTETVRNVFYIDPNGVIRAKLIPPNTMDAAMKRMDSSDNCMV